MLVNECCQSLSQFVPMFMYFYKKVRLTLYWSCVYYMSNRHLLSEEDLGQCSYISKEHMMQIFMHMNV